MNRRAGSIKLAVGVAIFVGFIVAGTFQTSLEPFNPYNGSLSDAFLPAFSHGHLLGTNDLGQDILSRLIAGVPWSLGVTALATLIAVVLGTTVGAFGALSSSLGRSLTQRVVDFGISIPALVIAVAVLAIAGHSFVALSLTLGLVSWPGVARVVLAQARSINEREFVLAARLLGASITRRVVHHVLPGLQTTLLVLISITYGDLLLASAGLSYLGLGAPITTPTWGNMLADGQEYLTSNPWMIAGPSLAIFLGVVAANLVADGFADRRRSTLGSATSARGVARVQRIEAGPSVVVDEPQLTG